MARKIRVAINGFGRIGRNALRVGFGHAKIEFVAVNDLTDPETLAHLLTHDTVYGQYDKRVSVKADMLLVDGMPMRVLAEKDPEKLPWKDLKIDVVLECTGRFTSSDGAAAHLRAGARKVIVSAPVKGGSIPTYVFGANADHYKGEPIINNASCTTNCISPIASVIHTVFGIKKAVMTTIHAVTAEQNIVDGPPPGLKKGDLRRARAAYQNMIPTSTGAAIATTEAIPELKGLFDGIAVRVPLPVVSLTDFVFLLKKKTTPEELNKSLVVASKQKGYRGIIGTTTEQLASSDFIKSGFSAIVDLSLTKVIDGDLVKIIAWYDNEWGYSCRLVEMALHVSR